MAEMDHSEKYLRVRNFEKFQHYRDRHPPWIKLYRKLWDDPRFFALSEADRYFLISFFVVASQNDNRVPVNEHWLQREMATRRSIPIDSLVQAGWLEWVEHSASTPLAPCLQEASAPLVLARSREGERYKEETYKKETEGEGDILPNPPLRVLGEFQNVRLSEDQYGKLKAKLNGRTDEYIQRFDGWVQEAPEAKAHGVRRKDRDAYVSISNWFNRDRSEGKHGKQSQQESPAEAQSRRTKEATQRALGKLARGNSGGISG